MVSAPFEIAPKNLFLPRIFPAAIAAFALGCLVMAGLVRSPDYAPTLFGAGKQFVLISPPHRESYASVLGAVPQHILQVADYWLNLPRACLPGGAVNDFQRMQCAEFQDRLLMATGFALVPLAAFALFVFIALDRFRLFYRRARKITKKGQALYPGTVTRPAQAPDDLFSWVYCLRPIAVQLAGGHQVVVYMPLSEPVPLPGQTLALFDGGKALGAKRLIGVLYAPHMAVVQGV